MTLEEYENLVFGIISYSGNAKALAYEGLRAAKKGDFISARERIARSGEELTKLHSQQMELIKRETNGAKNEFSVLLVHALDIMMDSLSAHDMITEMVDIYEALYKRTEKP